MLHSYSSPEGPATTTGHCWLIASLCLSLALHGLLAFIHTRSPIGAIHTAPSGLPATRLRVELPRARPAHPPEASANAQALPEIAAPSQEPSRRSDRRSDRHLPNDRQAPSQAEITVTSAHSDSGSTRASASIDLDAARASARQTARAQSAPMTGMEQETTDSAEAETALGQKISRAAHPDCRTSYAGAGLLALPLLLKDAVSEGGCRW